MRNVLAHRAAVVGASAMLLLFPFSTAAQADPVTQPDSTTQLSADALPAELVEAITRDLKISPQEYLDRAAKAQELGSYAEDFRAEHPDGFAGAWIGLDGQPVVAVTTTEAAAKALRPGIRRASRRSPRTASRRLFPT